jgi:uncharacterized phage protein gp47/JayE
MTQPCGCCEPIAPLTPLEVENRPALSAIAYRIGTYASFRESMLEEIVSTPELASLTTRRDDDYTITILDLWAAVADVLTFYQERYANEVFLRTATRRESVSRLARLIDYRLRPGVAALAWLAFTADEDKSFRVDSRLRVQSVPGQDEQPQVFEALESVVADWRLNRRRVMPAPYGINPLAVGSTSGLVAPGEDGLAAAAGLARGDRIAVFVTGSSGSVEVVTLDDVRTDEDRVELAWHGPIQGSWDVSSATAKVGRTFRLFGHTASEQSMVPSTASVPGGIRWTLAPTDFGVAAASIVALESRVENLATGARLIVDDEGGATTLVTVTAVATTSQSLAGLTDTVTVLTVTPNVPAIADRRRVTAYELAGPAVPFWGSAFPERLGGGTVFLPGHLVDAETVEVGRTIARGAYQPGVRLRIEDVSPRRTVLVGDAETDPVVGTVETAAIVGSTVTFEATPADKTSVRELGLDAASADPVVCLVSGPLPSSFALSSAAPALVVRIGAVGPRTLALGGGVTSRTSAASALEAALRGAGTEPELAGSRVFWLYDRLVVVPGAKGGEVVFTGTDADQTTVDELGLDPAHALTTKALRSAPLPDPVTLTNPAPEVAVTIGPVGSRVITPPSGVNLKGLAFSLWVQIAIADSAPSFRRSWIFASDGALIIFPGPIDAEVPEYLRLDLALDEPLDLDAGSAYLLGNVVAASHGETVRNEVLGNGDASARFQRFALKKQPLTYLPSEQEGGVESSLEVRVNNVLWDEAPGLYGKPPTAEAFATRTQDDGFTAVQFGDGVTGSTVPSGAANVLATYRTGAGVAGRVRAEMLTSALDRPPGLRAVTNPLAARGGADQENVDDARANAPATVRTFGRAVSLEDFADLVRATGEVAKAQAIWVWDGLQRMIHLTVAGQEGGMFADEGLRRIAASLDRERDPNYRLRIANFTPFPVLLRASVNVDPHYVSDDVAAAARAAALGALAFDAVELGTPIHLSDVYRILQDVPGVVAVDVDELQPKRPADRNRPNVDLLPDGVTPSPLQPHVRVFPARPDPAVRGAVLPAELAVVEDAARDVTVVAAGVGG